MVPGSTAHAYRTPGIARRRLDSIATASRALAVATFSEYHAMLRVKPREAASYAVIP